MPFSVTLPEADAQVLLDVHSRGIAHASWQQELCKALTLAVPPLGCVPTAATALRFDICQDSGKFKRRRGQLARAASQ
jgi:hypothetical protein